MGCGSCPALNQRVIHLGEDGSQSDLTIHEPVSTWLIPLLSVKVLGPGSQKCRRHTQRDTPCLLEQEFQFWQQVHSCLLSHFTLSFPTCIDRSNLTRSLTVTGSPVSANLSLRFSWMGLVQLHQFSKFFRQLSLRVTVGTGGGDR